MQSALLTWKERQSQPVRPGSTPCKPSRSSFSQKRRRRRCGLLTWSNTGEDSGFHPERSGARPVRSTLHESTGRLRSGSNRGPRPTGDPCCHCGAGFDHRDCTLEHCVSREVSSSATCRPAALFLKHLISESPETGNTPTRIKVAG
jgi:hypothetical protein